MAAEEPHRTVSVAIQDALDNLSSPRSSTDLKTRALVDLERILADACINTQNGTGIDIFVALQYTFECNIPSHVIAWMALTTAHLDSLTTAGPTKSSTSNDRYISTHTANLATALSILQGITLTHDASKRFLGRRYPLEVLVDLLLASRHVAIPTQPLQPSRADNIPLQRSGKTTDDLKPEHRGTIPGSAVPLTSIILDTLLCVLVDSSPALRNFEAVGGVQAVVKLLKRAGTERGVRMKCLEFLYFYLLDETASAVDPEPSPFVGSEQSYDGGSSTLCASSATSPGSDTEVEDHTMLNDAMSIYGSSTFEFTDSESGLPARNSSNATRPRSFSSESTASNGSSLSSSSNATAASESTWASSDYSTSYSTVASMSSSTPTARTPQTPARRGGLPSRSHLTSSLHSRSKSGLNPTTPSSIPKPSNNLPAGNDVNKVEDIPAKRHSVRGPSASRLILLKKDVDFEPVSPAPAATKGKLNLRLQTPPIGPGGAGNNLTPIPKNAPVQTPRKRLGIGLGTAAAPRRPVFEPRSDDDEDICRRLDISDGESRREHVKEVETSSLLTSTNDFPAVAVPANSIAQEDSHSDAPVADREWQNSGRRTAEQKKALLGTMLGNVDALVEGVRRAGVLGLS